VAQDFRVLPVNFLIRLRANVTLFHRGLS
jgi:hypothetical protein